MQREPFDTYISEINKEYLGERPIESTHRPALKTVFEAMV